MAGDSQIVRTRCGLRRWASAASTCGACATSCSFTRVGSEFSMSFDDSTFKHSRWMVCITNHCLRSTSDVSRRALRLSAGCGSTAVGSWYCVCFHDGIGVSGRGIDGATPHRGTGAMAARSSVFREKTRNFVSAGSRAGTPMNITRVKCNGG